VCRPFLSSEATKQYFPVMQFASLYKVAVTFKSVGEILKRSKATEQYFSCSDVQILCCTNKMATTLESMCGHSNENYRAIDSYCVAVSLFFT